MPNRVRVVVAVASTMAAFLGSLAAEKHPDFGAQIGTMGTVRGVALAIDAYRTDHKACPPTLRALIPEYLLDARLLRDSWHHPLVYFSSGDHFVLLSPGRDGRVDGQVAPPGGFGTGGDFDQDIVIVDGEWAQSPENVDR